MPSGVTIEVEVDGDGDDDMTSAAKMVRMLTAEPAAKEATSAQGAKPRARRPKAAPSEAEAEHDAERETEDDPRWWPFVANISMGARHVLACIIASPGISRADLAADAAGGKHNALSGFLRSIPTQAGHAGIEKDEVYYTAVDEEHGQGILFFPGPMLLAHGLGTPSTEGEEGQ